MSGRSSSVRWEFWSLCPITCLNPGKLMLYCNKCCIYVESNLFKTRLLKKLMFLVINEAMPTKTLYLFHVCKAVYKN